MSRITKAITEEVAIKMTVKNAEEIEVLKKELNDKAIEFHIANTPKEILEMYAKYPSYFKRATQFRLGSDFSYKYVESSVKLPYEGDSCFNNNYINFTNKEETKLVKLHYKIIDAEKALKDLRQDIKIALYSMRTYAKVEKEFNEAFKFLPKKIITAVSVDLGSIRKKLK